MWETAVLVFLGGWQPLPFLSFDFAANGFTKLLGSGVFLVKSIVLVWVQIWVRWTLPRLRIDQVMVMGYKYLVPIITVTLILAATYEYYGLRYIPGIG